MIFAIGFGEFQAVAGKDAVKQVKDRTQHRPARPAHQPAFADGAVHFPDGIHRGNDRAIGADQVELLMDILDLQPPGRGIKLRIGNINQGELIIMVHLLELFDLT